MTKLKRETFKTKNKHGEKGAALLYIGPVFCHGVVQEKCTKMKRIMINKSIIIHIMVIHISEAAHTHTHQGNTDETRRRNTELNATYMGNLNEDNRRDTPKHNAITNYYN